MYGLNRVKSVQSVKSYLAMAMLLCFGHAASAQQATAVLRDNVLSIPQAIVVDGDDVSYFRNIRLAQEGDGSFAITASESGDLAPVDAVEMLREADRVDVLVKGFRSACVSIQPEAVSYHDGEFLVAIPVSEPTSDACIAQAIEYYVITTLPTDGLSPGDYTVNVNGLKTDFTL